MTADPLPANARNLYTMWIRRKKPLTHWTLHWTGDQLWAMEMRKEDGHYKGLEFVILEPGQTPLLLVDVPYHDEGGES